MLAGIAALVALYFAATGRRGRLLLQLTGRRDRARGGQHPASAASRRPVAAAAAGAANTLGRPWPGRATRAEIAPAYLIAGTDVAKLDAALARLRARAEAEGGPGALESFSPPPGSSAGPDADGLVAAIPALSLTAARRYLLADGVERWSAKQAGPVAEALAALPPDVTVVLVAREQPPKLKAPKKLAEAVEAAGGKVLDVRGAEGPRPAALAGRRGR